METVAVTVIATATDNAVAAGVWVLWDIPVACNRLDAR